MIFLGAGASKPFGVKTLEEMSTDVVEIMREKDYGEIVDAVDKGLRRFKITPDFEAYYTVVEALANLDRAIKSSGPLTAYVCEDIEKLRPKKDLTELSRIFKDFIYNECQPKLEYVPEIVSLYDRLFNITAGVHERRYVEGVEQQPSVRTDYTIVTTNYDMIIESYHIKRKESFADGFKPTTENPLIKNIDLTTYSYKRERWLIKLHGSIWQYRNNSNIFKTNVDPSGINLIPINIQEQMMIYPTDEKPILRYPYFDLYRIFRQQKWEKLIVIGYSFRDEPVNMAIIENLKLVKDSNLIVVNPHPEEVLQNLEPTISSGDRDPIIRIEGKFGDEEVFKKLECAVNTRSQQHYDRKLREYL